MKINESGRITSVNAYRNGYQNQDSRIAGKGKQANMKDNVQISPEALEMLEAERANQGDRAERLEQLRASVQNGTYRVDAEKLAEKLLPFFK